MRNLSKTFSQGVGLAAILALILIAPMAQADFDQALDDFKRGKYAEAAAGFQEIVDQQPEYDYGHFLLGMSLLKMSKYDDAETSIQKALDINDARFEYHHGLANVRYKAKNYAKTVAALKTGESLAADGATKFALYRLRGLSYVALEKWADAAQDLEAAKKLKKDPVVLDRLSLSYYKLRHYDKAVPVMRDALAAKSDDSSLLMRMTNSLLNLGAEAKSDSEKDKYYGDALVYAEKLAAVKSNDTDVTNLVGRAALGAKSYPKAEQAFKKVVAKDSKQCYAMVNLGKVYIGTEKWSSAEDILTAAAECAPKMAVVYESLGFAMMKQKKLEPAIVQFNKALKIKPSGMTREMIRLCEENLNIAAQNANMDAEEQAQAEKNRIAAEENAKAEAAQKAWEEAQKKRDD